MRPFSAPEKPLHTGVRTGFQYFNSLSVCRSVCLLCSACLRFLAISSIARAVQGRFPEARDLQKAREPGLTRGACFVARRLEVLAVAGLLWLRSCVLGAAGFRVVFVGSFSSKAHGLQQVRGPLALFTSLLLMV